MSATCPRCLQPLAPEEVHEFAADCRDAGWTGVKDVPREKPAAGAELLMVPIDQIETESNVRKDLGDLEELAASIKAVGVLQPITVHRKPGHRTVERFVLDIGHRRLAAAALAQIQVIPALVTRPNPTAVGRSIEQLIENIQRADLNPLEEAEAFRAILAADPALTQKALADRLGKSPAAVSNALRILELEPEVQALVSSGQLSGAHAKALVGVSPTRQKVLAQSVATDRVSSHSLEQQIAYERQLAESEETKAARTAKLIPKIIEALEKAGVPKSAPLDVVIYQWELMDGTAIRKAIKAAGYNETNGMSLSAAPERGECDCVAFRAEVSGRSPKIVAACTDRRHQDRQRNLEHVESKADLAEREAWAEGFRSAIAQDLDAANFSDRLLRLFAAYIYQGGIRPTAETEPAELRAMMVRTFGVLWRLEGWQREGLLDAYVPPPEPISAAEAAERVVVKRAARRAAAGAKA